MTKIVSNLLQAIEVNEKEKDSPARSPTEFQLTLGGSLEAAAIVKLREVVHQAQASEFRW
jgi:hypothetical protein